MLKMLSRALLVTDSIFQETGSILSLDHPEHAVYKVAINQGYVI